MAEPQSCAVPGCWRRAKSKNPLCERCWSHLSDEERSGLLFALHAPFFTRYGGWGEAEPGDLTISESIAGSDIELRPSCVSGNLGIECWSAGSRVWAVSFSQYMRTFERRTTLDAIAETLALRRAP